MSLKSFRKEHPHFFTLLAAMFIFFVLPFDSQAQTQSLPNSLSLTIEFGGAYNQGFKICMPIFVNDQLELVWTKGLVQSSISAIVSKPKDGAYPIKFVLKEGMLNYMREVKLESKLELEKPYQSVRSSSNTFEVIYKQTLLLSKEDCK